MKNLALEDYGILELSSSEMEELNGGLDWTGILKGSGWAYLGTQVITHWSEIKSGFKAGLQANI